VSQDVNNGYDTFDSFVCFAEDEESARKMHPSGNNYFIINDFSHCWTSSDKVKVEFLSKADDKVEAGVILASFNAG
jgi:hypothetical protein